ncbi:MAG: 16S rRNA (uracil(1498)-N(3))-methyltransferase [Burkholderiaceae bacterium]|jgi:16S rRNA (uracil1498-N3)-methyltransferase|nr:16S rRNA (uracil(1498)-N(3))-methyltransferase [Burkholderiaceae bacterium]
MPPRIHVPDALAAGAELALPAGAARHVQVLRMQPGDALTLFDGAGGEWSAAVTHMGRSAVHVRLGVHTAIEREAERPVHLAVGLMAAERMDWLVEKATELGAASLQPLLTERASLRLSGERAEKKRAHWHAVAVASCEQNGRNRLLDVRQQLSLQEHMRQPAALGAVCWLLSLGDAATPLGHALAALPPGQPVALLSGPEGGLTPAEEAAAEAAGYRPVGLGRRVLRAETAPLAALAALTVDIYL